MNGPPPYKPQTRAGSKALGSKAGIAGTFHKDGTVTTDAFKQTMDARQRCANAGSRESLQYDNGS